MKLIAIMFMCIATYLWFPLPNGKTLEVSLLKGKTKTQNDPQPIELKPATRSEVLRALEVIRLGISAGMTVSDAIEYAQARSSLAAAQDLELVTNQFRLGLPLTRGLEEIAIRNPLWLSMADTLIATFNSGSPAGDHLSDVEIVMQSTIDNEKLKRIKSVAVKSVLPLGLCFLPAFMLLAVIPIVAGLLNGMTS
jgi:pilus assembly protein TadC